MACTTILVGKKQVMMALLSLLEMTIHQLVFLPPKNASERKRSNAEKVSFEDFSC